LRYYTRTRKDVTFEYILLRGFNDSLADAQELVKYASDVHAKVNLIEYNPIDGGEFGRTDAKDAEAFQHYLDRRASSPASAEAVAATSTPRAGNWPTRTSRRIEGG
jgi:adenine C2-methylase RlmN of 23S rRNA A2503 and tRNA A37